MTITAKKPRKPKSPDVIKSKSDDKGNLLILKNNGKRIILILKLRTHKKLRRIGVVNLKRKVFEVKRKRDKHLMRVNQSYGFNHKLLADAKLFDKIRLMDEHAEWLIPVSYILENGTFMNFINKGGFELQIFIPLHTIEHFKKEPRI